MSGLVTDIELVGADFRPSVSGDAATVSGLACLIQDLRTRLGTPRGGHWLYPEFGCSLIGFLGGDDTPQNRAGMALEAQSALQDDDRIEAATVGVVAWSPEEVELTCVLRGARVGELPEMRLSLRADAVALEVA